MLGFPMLYSKGMRLFMFQLSSTLFGLRQSSHSDTVLRETHQLQKVEDKSEGN